MKQYFMYDSQFLASTSNQRRPVCDSKWDPVRDFFLKLILFFEHLRSDMFM